MPIASASRSCHGRSGPGRRGYPGTREHGARDRD
jgi:hypothetical protein